MRRAGRFDRRRRAAAAQRDAGDRRGIIARKKFVYLCTNALLLEKKIDQYEAVALFHLVDPSRRRPGRCTTARCARTGVYRQSRRRDQGGQAPKASASASTARCSTTPSRSASPRSSTCDEGLGSTAITVSPGYAYERAPDQEHFLNRAAHQVAVPRHLPRGHGGRKLAFNQSSLFLDFLAGNQTYDCTPWGNPTRNVFGWQRPCYLLGEGYATTFKELMETTDWDTVRHRQLREMRRLHGPLRLRGDRGDRCRPHPLKALKVALRGVEDRRPDGAGDPARSATAGEYVFDRHVEQQATPEMRQVRSRRRGRGRRD